MNLFQIFDSIAKVDEDFYDRTAGRRACFKHLAGAGKKLAAAAVPLAVSSIFNKAYAGETGVKATVAEVFQFALRLERFEAAFYNAAFGQASALGLSTAPTSNFMQIRQDENDHVDLLTTVLTTILSASLPPADTYDLTGGGAYPSIVTAPDRTVFLALAQAFEDTGVRAYKGGAADLMSNDTLLTAALNIHSVEARHAAYWRTVRGEKAWITQAQTTIPGIGSGVYGKVGNPAASFPSEANTSQGGVAAGFSSITDAAIISEAFDEPLNAAAVLDITRPFGVG
jgi:Ferritin-like domain